MIELSFNAPLSSAWTSGAPAMALARAVVPTAPAAAPFNSARRSSSPAVFFSKNHLASAAAGAPDKSALSLHTRTPTAQSAARLEIRCAYCQVLLFSLAERGVDGK